MKIIGTKYRGPKIHIKKSRFIATIIPVQTTNEVTNAVLSIQTEMKKASHNAYAYRLFSGAENFSDDGEVPLTAGIQIFKVLEQFELVNAALIVTRYYGGTNLGKGGLIRAYYSTAKDLLENIPLENYEYI